MNVRILLLLAGLLPYTAVSAAEDDSSWLDSGRQWVQGLWQGEAEQWLQRINPALMASVVEPTGSVAPPHRSFCSAPPRSASVARSTKAVAPSPAR